MPWKIKDLRQIAWQWWPMHNWIVGHEVNIMLWSSPNQVSKLQICSTTGYLSSNNKCLDTISITNKCSFKLEMPQIYHNTIIRFYDWISIQRENEYFAQKSYVLISLQKQNIAQETHLQTKRYQKYIITQ